MPPTKEPGPETLNEQQLLVAIYKAVATIRTIMVLAVFFGVLAAVVLIAEGS